MHWSYCSLVQSHRYDLYFMIYDPCSTSCVKCIDCGFQRQPDKVTYRPNGPRPSGIKYPFNAHMWHLGLPNPTRPSLPCFPVFNSRALGLLPRYSYGLIPSENTTHLHPGPSLSSIPYLLNPQSPPINRPVATRLHGHTTLPTPSLSARRSYKTSPRRRKSANVRWELTSVEFCSSQFWFICCCILINYFVIILSVYC